MEQPASSPDAEGQIARLLDAVRDVLGGDIVGAYLFGSAAVGDLKPRSDIDVMVISGRATTRDEKQRLVSQLLDLSKKPRHLELTIVVQSEISPWRYPPRMDLQYGDWWRQEFESGDLEPWGSPENPDLASLIRMVLLADHSLLGPPPAEVFEPVPRRDYLSALTHAIDGLLEEVGSDTTNVLLTLARIWFGIVTDEVASKNAAVDWVLPRIPAKHRGVLAEARAIYLGERERESDAFLIAAPLTAEYLTAEIASAQPA